MGRPKGGSNRRWTSEERLKYVLMCEEEHMPILTASKEFGIPYGTLDSWVRRYRKGRTKLLIQKTAYWESFCCSCIQAKALLKMRD